MPPWLYWILLGLVAGTLAKFLMPGRDPSGCIVTVALGVVGAFIGGIIGGLINDRTNIFELHVLGFIIAVIAAVLLVGVPEGLSGGRKRAGP